MRMKSIFAAAIALVLFASCCTENRCEVSSPDGELTLLFEADDKGIHYSLDEDEEPILLPSTMGFELKSGDLSQGFTISDVSYSSVDDSWEQTWGEERIVRNNYNEMTVSLTKSGESALLMKVIFRLFDDGMGFRYEFPEQEALSEFVIMDELTEFRFAQDHPSWWLPKSDPYYEAIARNTPISEVDTARTPFTIEGKDGRFYAIHEANLTDFAKVNLIPTDHSTLEVMLTPWADGAKVYAQSPMATPWRTIIVGDRVGDLVESRLMLNLNEPSKIEDTSWIVPGKYIGIWWTLHLGNHTWYQGPKHGANTALTKHYMDFAAENGFNGVLVEGWNEGWDGNWMKSSDKINFTKAYPDFDLFAITEYGAQKGVKLIGHHETAANSVNYERQMEEAFKLYADAGVSQVKTGNVNVLRDGKEEHDGQYGVRHMRKVVESAAKHKISIIEHEPVMPTGVSRTWPNLLSSEGVRGQEHNAWAEDGGNPPHHTTEVPFIRGLAGPMDFTFGTFNFENKHNPHARVQTTLAKQLALYVVIYSPVQMASDLPENYDGVPAFEFIKDVPVDWEQTHVVDAKIGDYAVFARQDRNSSDWYLGAITDENARELSVKLDFLTPDKSYTAQIYSDGDGADWQSNPTPVEISELTVTNQSTLDLNLATSGGTAIRFIEK